ncbi:SgrR family transcriptional regulator [Cohnella terricola]|uniref:SgrR family transcriptional regulator n=1 Tax=Cohnella terricola TaxID=1289167 RepID=UPI00164947EC|nr:SgrR family transcriptional regulator [Cohnella terricola]
MSTSVERYLMLLNTIGNQTEIGVQIETTTEEISKLLFCTARNAKMIIKRLTEEKWIEWHSGRGRGNVSRIVFLVEKEPFLIEKARETADKGEYKQAFEMLRTFGAGAATVDRFMLWLNDHFGYQSEGASGSETLDTLRFPVYYRIWTLDPSKVYYAFDAHMIKQLYDRLVEYDASTGMLKPGLAHFWESNEDGSEWTFYLRKGIRFHHGRELQAEDVRYTIERMRGAKPSSWLVRSVREVVCLGDRCVRIMLERPNTIFPRFASSAGMSILPRDLLQEDDEQFWKKPIGTGPFRIVGLSGDSCEMVANTEYYQGRAHLDRVVIAFMPEETAVMSENATWKQLLYIQKPADPSESSSWHKMESLCRGSMLLTWNSRKQGPQSSIDFRRAFGLFLNRKKMIRELGEDRVYPARGFRPTEQTPYLNEDLDEEEARRLLRKSGYNGEELLLCTYGAHESDARWIEKRCAEFGVNAKVLIETHGSVRKRDIFPEVDCILFCLVFAVEDVCEIENYEQTGNLLKEMLRPDVHEWVTQQINHALACQDPGKRRELLDGIENRLRDEAHVTFILHKKMNTYVHPAVKGVGFNSLGWIDFKDIWLENRTMIYSAQSL